MTISLTIAPAAIRPNLSHRAFHLAIVLKGLNGLCELLAGLGLWFCGPTALGRIAMEAIDRALAADPDNAAFLHLRGWLAGLTPDSQTFAIVYLLVHGLVKLTLAIGLLQNRRSAYPIAVLLFVLFIAYMLYRLTLAWSWGVSGLALLDTATLALILQEWRVAARRRARVMFPA